MYDVLCVRQVKSRVAVLNQRHPKRTIWKESAICTKTWNSSVLQLIDVSACARLQCCCHCCHYAPSSWLPNPLLHVADIIMLISA